MRNTRSSIINSFLVEAPKSATGSAENFLEIRDDDDLGVGNETVEDILNEVLVENNFQQKVSDSSLMCSRGRGVKDDLVMDPRLRAWNRMLEQRQRLQKRIERETGKRPEDVLFNRPVTIDESSKRMILRVLDTADRSRPVARLHADLALDSLKPRLDPEQCREIRELYAARPAVQPVEFVGLPQVTQEELAVVATESQWERSEVLGQRILSKKHAIQQVIEFVPDLQELQVVQTEVVLPTQTAPISMVAVENLTGISADSSSVEEEEFETESDHMLIGEEGEQEDGPVETEVTKGVGVGQVETNEVDELQKENGVMINGCFFQYRDMRATKKVNLLLKCDPHQRVVKTVLDIQNLSSKFLHGYWARGKCMRSDHQPLDCELIFERCEFIMEPQQRRVIRVLFHPQQVGLITQRWSLYLIKSPFCGTRRLEVVLQGLCTMPAPYQRRVQRHRQAPLEQQQRQQAQGLLQMQASLAPIIENPPLLCPYQKVLDERELFNAQNPSYRCERYADLEALKEIYALAKKPRDRPWDLSIEALRRIIGRQEARFLRERMHKSLMELLQPMKCNRCEAFTRLDHNPERQRACFIYVRGTISTAVDDWEKMAMSLDDQFFKLELQRSLVAPRAEQQEEEEQSKNSHHDDLWEVSEELQTLESISKKVRANKYLKDALYMQTYNLLCDAAEDIVSVIESTSQL